MNSKESLKWLKDHHEYLIKQYFDNPFVSKEEAFELANQKFIKIEQHIDELEKENQKLKERYKHRAKLCEEFCEYNKQYEKAIEILKENLYIEFKHDDYFMVKFKEDKEQECDYTIMFLDNKEEYELLKEVLE